MHLFLKNMLKFMYERERVIACNHCHWSALFSWL